MYFIGQPEIYCSCMHFIELKIILEAKSCSKKQGLKLDALKDIKLYWQSITREYIEHVEMSVGHRQSSTAKDLSMGNEDLRLC